LAVALGVALDSDRAVRSKVQQHLGKAHVSLALDGGMQRRDVFAARQAVRKRNVRTRRQFVPALGA
jgi:hypothetical protein